MVNLSAIQAEVPDFLEILGLTEEPLGMYYTEVEPREGFSPQSACLPNVEQEAAGEVDWQATFENFACVIGLLWRARKLGKPAYFDQTRFGCLGGAFYLGFLKPQLEFITHYVSTGIPNVLEGECYLESPEVTRRFFADHRPPAGPGALLRFQIPQPVYPPGKSRGGDLFRPGRSHRWSQPTGHLRHQRLRGGGVALWRRVQQHRHLAPEIPGAGAVEGGVGRLGPIGPQVFEAGRNYLYGALGDVRPDGPALPGVLSHPAHLGRGPEEDRPEPQGLERSLKILSAAQAARLCERTRSSPGRNIGRP